MAHTKQERWTCDVPGCESLTEKDPLGEFFGIVSRVFKQDPSTWRRVFGLLVCEKHAVSIVLDGVPLQIPSELAALGCHGEVAREA